MSEISPRELQDLRLHEPVVVIDVREPWEFEICRIDGALPVPLAELPDRAGELAADALTVVVCHHGMRSQAAAEYLRGLGFTRVLNLTGGIHRWSEDVNPAMPQY
ncbi:MAG: rhodanese-like domain-containing protein [Gammaproteobacteria bacterium]